MIAKAVLYRFARSTIRNPKKEISLSRYEYKKVYGTNAQIQSFRDGLSKLACKGDLVKSSGSYSPFCIAFDASYLTDVQNLAEQCGVQLLNELNPEDKVERRSYIKVNE